MCWPEKGMEMGETRLHEFTDPEARKALGEVVRAEMERWGLPDLVQASLLGIAHPADLTSAAVPPEDRALWERIGHLLAIARALKAAYPYRPGLRDRWLMEPHGRLGGRTPLEAMLAGGMEGIREVRDVAESEVDEAN